MADLAEGQGGRDGGRNPAHAQASTSEKNNGAHDSLEQFIARGEKILENFVAGIQGFEDQARRFQTLESSVSSLQKQFNENSKRPREHENQGCSKASKPLTPTDDASDLEPAIEVGDDCCDPIDSLLQGPSTDGDLQDDILVEMKDFFTAEQLCGDPVQNNVATIVNDSLRGVFDKEKMGKVLDKNKRPGNVDTLQIPWVPSMLWEQLKNSTKTADANKQKLIGQANQALVPIVQAMDHLTGNKTPNIYTLTTHIGDAFKILASQITLTNQRRRESIKTELTPQFRGLCGEDHPTSATQLFGDKFNDAVKTMDQGKQVQLTMKSSSQPQQPPFLGQQGGGGPIDGSHKCHTPSTLPNQ